MIELRMVFRPPSSTTSGHFSNGVKELKALRARGYGGLCYPINDEMPTRGFLRSMRRHGLRSLAFIAQTRSQMERLEALEIDYAVATGAPSLMPGSGEVARERLSASDEDLN